MFREFEINEQRVEIDKQFLLEEEMRIRLIYHNWIKYEIQQKKKESGSTSSSKQMSTTREQSVTSQTILFHNHKQ